MSVITLTTDFGLGDPFVGQMKGVILSIAPEATIVDLTHEVPPQDVLAAAIALESAQRVFPPSTVHVAVVDPGVGSPRRPIAVETENDWWVGPDNGIFTAVLQSEIRRASVVLTNRDFHRPQVSATFHGRDIFAPVAAYLTSGIGLGELGESVGNLLEIDLPVPDSGSCGLVLHILCIDRFGNLVTDLTGQRLLEWRGDRSADQLELRAGPALIRGISRTFSDVPEGRPVAYIGSNGRLEIAVRNGHAATDLNAKRGDTIRLQYVS